jgi:hypothetical protein
MSWSRRLRVLRTATARSTRFARRLRVALPWASAIRDRAHASRTRTPCVAATAWSTGTTVCASATESPRARQALAFRRSQNATARPIVRRTVPYATCCRSAWRAGVALPREALAGCSRTNARPMEVQRTGRAAAGGRPRASTSAPQSEPLLRSKPVEGHVGERRYFFLARS